MSSVSVIQLPTSATYNILSSDRKNLKRCWRQRIGPALSHCPITYCRMWEKAWNVVVGPAACGLRTAPGMSGIRRGIEKPIMILYVLWQLYSYIIEPQHRILGGEYLSLSLGFSLHLTIQLEGGELHKRSGGYEPNLLRRETNLEGGKGREFSRLGSRQWTLSQKL
jgi:hypothetical protein